METHGLTYTTEYKAWQSIKSRCHNPKAANYRNYGARGIQVCAKWRDSFPAFLADMGAKPSAKHSLDRKDNDGDYTPDNCRWAAPLEQARNKRTNRVITFNGHTRTVSEWAEALGLKPSTLGERLKRWTVEEALTRPYVTKAEIARIITRVRESRRSSAA